ncbi:IclR family transcriptional regulator (plasmid) [Agrobacterium sp. rho-13.3]|uniref:IclR family transcriptional regulator n=1 Tax=Agrobacterium sp. rho-13.3 TaxID=3072980 RepID=UPI002A17EF25|nr:IclR family transcriptional regulator [Agrobacterium sp. rho-13.3]MDX8312036.1 IclR family transcriptional regulator [Agrobacterium sp. rho-13.3]
MNSHNANIGRDPSQDTGPGSVKSATRVLDLFEFLGRWDAEKTHAEIAEELNIPKSSLTQLLKTLLQRGYLAYSATSKGYRLGPSIASLATKVHGNTDIIAAAGPVLTWMASETQETCAINLIKGDQSEVMASAIGPHRLNFTMRQGDVAPLYATSGGKALLAHLPSNMLEEYLGRVTFEKFASNTIDSVERLREELEQVRKTGFAYVREEFTQGIMGVSTAVLSASGYPLASLNIATPVSRFDLAKQKLCEETLARAATTLHRKVA